MSDYEASKSLANTVQLAKDTEKHYIKSKLADKDYPGNSCLLTVSNTYEHLLSPDPKSPPPSYFCLLSIILLAFPWLLSME